MVVVVVAGLSPQSRCLTVPLSHSLTVLKPSCVENSGGCFQGRFPGAVAGLDKGHVKDKSDYKLLGPFFVDILQKGEGILFRKMCRVVFEGLPWLFIVLSGRVDRK